MTEMLPYVGKFLKHLPNYNIQPLILVHALTMLQDPQSKNSDE